MNCFNSGQVAWANHRESVALSQFSSLIHSLYSQRRMRRLCIVACLQLEGGRFFSRTLRRILLTYHGVSVGNYSYGACLMPGLLPHGTIVGSYCSIAEGLSVHRRNHPPNTLSQHPFFYNSNLGLLHLDSIERIEENPLKIGNDVWLGDRVTVLPGCQIIGDGAVVGAGSIVTRNVEPFTVVAGNPAQPIRKRYSDEVIAEVQRSEWWNLTLPELLSAGDLLLEPLELSRLRSFVEEMMPSSRKVKSEK